MQIEMFPLSQDSADLYKYRQKVGGRQKGVSRQLFPEKKVFEGNVALVK